MLERGAMCIERGVGQMRIDPFGVGDGGRQTAGGGS